MPEENGVLLRSLLLVAAEPGLDARQPHELVRRLLRHPLIFKLDDELDEPLDRLPMLDGVMVYAADDWGDRGADDYRFPRETPVWSGGAQLGRFAGMLQHAFAARQRRLLFSMWEAPTLWADFATTMPPNLTAVVHLTYPGFDLAHGFNPMLTNGAARHPDFQLYVALDPRIKYSD